MMGGSQQGFVGNGQQQGMVGGITQSMMGGYGYGGAARPHSITSKYKYNLNICMCDKW